MPEAVASQLKIFTHINSIQEELKIFINRYPNDIFQSLRFKSQVTAQHCEIKYNYVRIWYNLRAIVNNMWLQFTNQNFFRRLYCIYNILNFTCYDGNIRKIVFEIKNNWNLLEKNLTQEHLTDLAILSIEGERSETLNFIP